MALLQSVNLCLYLSATKQTEIPLPLNENLVIFLWLFTFVVFISKNCVCWQYYCLQANWPKGCCLSSGSFLHGFHISFSYSASDYVTTASSTFFPICYSLIILPSYAILFEQLTVSSFL